MSESESKSVNTGIPPENRECRRLTTDEEFVARVGKFREEMQDLTVKAISLAVGMLSPCASKGLRAEAERFLCAVDALMYDDPRVKGSLDFWKTMKGLEAARKQAIGGK